MKSDNPQVIRMTESLKKNVGIDQANEFEKQYPLSKSADINKKYEWAKSVCSYLEKTYDLSTIKKIRKECPCNDGISIANKLTKYLKKTNTIKDFVLLFNENEKFASLEYISENSILFCYPTCYCACIKRIPKEISKTWCYCTLGNVEEIFRLFFNKDVKTELLETVKTGGSRCAIKVEWK